MGAIYLVRHGQASFGAADYDALSPRGFEQSTVVGTELLRRNVSFNQIRSGSLARQRDTAATALKVLDTDVPVVEDPRWNEYDHLGLVPAGQPAPADSRDFQRELDKAIEAWITGGYAAGVTGTWLEFSGGVDTALRDAFATLPKGKAGLVFTSAGVISAICAALLAMPTAGYLALNRTMANAAITKLVSGRSGMSLVSLNEHGHFEGPHRGLLTYR